MKFKSYPDTKLEIRIVLWIIQQDDLDYILRFNADTGVAIDISVLGRYYINTMKKNPHAHRHYFYSKIQQNIPAKPRRTIADMINSEDILSVQMGAQLAYSILVNQK